MTKYVIGIDYGGVDGSPFYGGSDEQYMKEVAEVVKACGNEVETTIVDPNQESHLKGHGADIAVFLCNGVDPWTMWSFISAIKAGTLPYTIFALEGWYHNPNEPGGTLESMDTVRAEPFAVPHDGNKSDQGAMNQSSAATTVGEYVDENSQYIGLCFATTPKEMGERICNGTCGQASSGGSQELGVGGVLIPDKTFWGLIKQMIGGIDGLFIIANNMAYLLSFKDFYEYRNRFDEFIPILTTNDIIDNSIEKGWTTDGFYNAVEITYNSGIIRFQHDVLVEQYGENVWYYEFPEDDEETARAKGTALLSAHVRDYALDIKMTVVYQPNITVGSWVKVPKSITKVTKGQEEKENDNKKIDINDTITVNETLNITEITSYMQEITGNNNAKQLKVKNKKGEEYFVTTEDTEYETFFVQGYSLRWDSSRAPLMDIHLKYGPDTPEDPINATIGTGSVATNVGGTYGNDCFSICDICIENCDKILPAASGRRADAEEYIKSHEPDPAYLVGRARQGSTYVNEVAGMTSAEAYTLFRNKFSYACYWDSCDLSYPCCEDLWTKANACNCGDGTRMVKVLMDATNTPCYGIHVDHHYFNAVKVNGEWETLDSTRGAVNSSCGFPDGNWGAGSNDCGSGWCYG